MDAEHAWNVLKWPIFIVLGFMLGRAVARIEFWFVNRKDRR